MNTVPLITESIRTAQRGQLLDITDRVQQAALAHGISDGLAILHVPHTTAAITINENADPDVQHDILSKLETLIPQNQAFYRHSEGNSDSHVKTSLVGNSVTVLIERGRLVLGTWQAIYFCEFDGPRQRQFMIKLVRFT